MADLVTLAEVTAALNITDATHDVELALYIDAVTEHVEARFGALPSATFTESVDATTGPDGTAQLVTSRYPVLSVTSITRRGGTAITTGFTITPDGYIEHANLHGGRWTVEYVAGYAAIPADLKIAALEDIRGLYQPGQIGPPGAFGAFGIDSADTGPTYRPVRMWPRVDAWIESRRIPAIA